MTNRIFLLREAPAAEKNSRVVEDNAATIEELARSAQSTQVIVIETDPMGSTDAGGFWWDVAVPAVSERDEVGASRRGYEEARKLQRVGD